jgi:uncharacterized iron-regulated membrane protein
MGFDVHKVVGIASLAFHLPVAGTGALLALAVAAPPPAGTVEVRERDGGVVWMHRATGVVTIVGDPRRPDARGWALAAALHEGRFAGPVSRWLYVAGGLTPVVLAITGLGIWLGRPLTRPSPLRSEGER